MLVLWLWYVCSGYNLNLITSVLFSWNFMLWYCSSVRIMFVTIFHNIGRRGFFVFCFSMGSLSPTMLVPTFGNPEVYGVWLLVDKDLPLMDIFLNSKLRVWPPDLPDLVNFNYVITFFFKLHTCRRTYTHLHRSFSLCKVQSSIASTKSCGQILNFK